jgi:hypothetical protein
LQPMLTATEHTDRRKAVGVISKFAQPRNK